jgi:ribosomal protein L20A (L18A)
MMILLKYHLNYAAGVYAEKEWMTDTESAEVTFMDNAEDAVEVDKNAVEVTIENAEAVDAYKEDAGHVEEQGRIETMRSLLPEENVVDTFVNNVTEACTMNVSSSNYKPAVRLPTTKNIEVVNSKKAQYKAVLSAWGDAACLSQGDEEDAACLNLRVMGEQSKMRQGMLTAYLTKMAMEEQIYREVEDSSAYSVREEVLAELGEQFKVFPPTQRKKKYEVAKQQGVEKNIVKEMMKEEKPWQKQTSRFYQPSL